MATTIRQQIMDKYGARLKTIRPATYQTDIGPRRVFEWKTTAWSDAEIPGASYRDPDDAITVIAPGRHMHELRVETEIILSGADGVVPAQMRQAIADLMAAIKTDLTWGGLAEYTHPLQNKSIEIEQAGKKYCGIKFDMIIVYVTDEWEG